MHVLPASTRSRPRPIVTERSWNDRRDLTGPFDIIGDVHGCASELRTLLDRARLAARARRRRPRRRRHPPRGPHRGVRRRPGRPRPRHPGRAPAGDGHGRPPAPRCACPATTRPSWCGRCKGAKVTVAHGLAESLEQLAAEPEEFRAAALAFMDGLISHFVLDDGRLVVAHAGLKEAYHGRGSGRVRSFALYGDTTGETDEYGLPGALPVGAGVPRPGDGRLRPHPGAGGGVGQQHDLPRHRRGLRRHAHRAALPRAGDRRPCRPSSSGTSRSGRWSRRPTAEREATVLRDRRRRRRPAGWRRRTPAR